MAALKPRAAAAALDLQAGEDEGVELGAREAQVVLEQGSSGRAGCSTARFAWCREGDGHQNGQKQP